ncbi:hypothetical protein [Halorubellus sp. PRR65]|uniref:hypothetical protein n=1 Tax=Halorubellus sp. PRR65 TaxID=3098148 RepID=UPI002B260626|nr:hypothetical protein [Halorubellus sp. PRR65]
MSDGSKEETVEKSTDELLSETDDILSGLDDGGSGDADASSAASGRGSSVDDAVTDLDAEAGTRDRSTNQGTGGTDAASGSTATDDRGFRKYFDPSSAGISAVLVFAGAMAGGVVPIPFVGGLARLLGVGVGAFAHGLGASDSRYAETLVASGVVGFLVAVLTTNMFVTLSGVGVPVLAVSTIATMLVALVGHYFGRDLRAGLTADVDGGNGGGQDDDVPGW